jgi:hypothetical protein
MKLNAARIALNEFGVIHHDFLPKNILVKINSNKNILDVCLTDFGNAIFENDWYYSKKKLETRVNYVDYFISDEKIGPTLTRIFEGIYGENGRVKLRDFLLYNVKNFDLAFLLCYDFYTKKLDLPLVMPSVFNFELPWERNGTLPVVFVKQERNVVHFNHISGSTTLFQFRVLLNVHGIQFTRFDGADYSPDMQEQNQGISSVLRMVHGVVFLCII